MRKSAFIGSFLYLIVPLASAVSLTNFQKLTVDVSEACTIAYDRTIPFCKTSDFTISGTCSSACVSGLVQVASGVLESCGGVVVGSSTLLGRIFKDDIISSLCPNNDKFTSSAEQQTTTATPATTAQSATQSPPDQTSSAKASAATPSSSSASAESSSSSAAAQSSSLTDSSSPTTAAAASSASLSTTSSAAAQTSTSQSQSQSGNGRSGMTVQQQQIAAMVNSGGGSPFDIVGYSAASRPSQRDLNAITLGIALMIAGWLLR